MAPPSTSDKLSIYIRGKALDWLADLGGDVLPALTILAVVFTIASFNGELLMTMMKRWRGQSFGEERTSEKAAFGCSGVTKSSSFQSGGVLRVRGTRWAFPCPAHSLRVCILLPITTGAANNSGTRSSPILLLMCPVKANGW